MEGRVEPEQLREMLRQVLERSRDSAFALQPAIRMIRTDLTNVTESLHAIENHIANVAIEANDMAYMLDDGIAMLANNDLDLALGRPSNPNATNGIAHNQPQMIQNTPNGVNSHHVNQVNANHQHQIHDVQHQQNIQHHPALEHQQALHHALQQHQDLQRQIDLQHQQALQPHEDVQHQPGVQDNGRELLDNDQMDQLVSDQLGSNQLIPSQPTFNHPVPPGNDILNMDGTLESDFVQASARVRALGQFNPHHNGNFRRSAHPQYAPVLDNSLPSSNVEPSYEPLQNAYDGNASSRQASVGYDLMLQQPFNRSFNDRGMFDESGMPESVANRAMQDQMAPQSRESPGNSYPATEQPSAQGFASGTEDGTHQPNMPQRRAGSRAQTRSMTALSGQDNFHNTWAVFELHFQQAYVNAHEGIINHPYLAPENMYAKRPLSIKELQTAHDRVLTPRRRPIRGAVNEEKALELQHPSCPSTLHQHREALLVRLDSTLGPFLTRGRPASDEGEVDEDEIEDALEDHESLDGEVETAFNVPTESDPTKNVTPVASPAISNSAYFDPAKRAGYATPPFGSKESFLRPGDGLPSNYNSPSPSMRIQPGESPKPSSAADHSYDLEDKANATTQVVRSADSDADEDGETEPERKKRRVDEGKGKALPSAEEDDEEEEEDLS